MSSCSGHSWLPVPVQSRGPRQHASASSTPAPSNRSSRLICATKHTGSGKSGCTTKNRLPVGGAAELEKRRGSTDNAAFAPVCVPGTTVTPDGGLESTSHVCGPCSVPLATTSSCGMVSTHAKDCGGTMVGGTSAKNGGKVLSKRLPSGNSCRAACQGAEGRERTRKRVGWRSRQPRSARARPRGASLGPRTPTRRATACQGRGEGGEGAGVLDRRGGRAGPTRTRRGSRSERQSQMCRY